MRNLVSLMNLAGAAVLVTIIAAPLSAIADEWKAPASAEARKNPVALDAASIAAGKKVWMKECAECHGNTGKGDGEKSAELKKDPGDLSDSKKIGSQSDGALFWKITVGRQPMPPYLKIPEEQRWQMVNYMRSISKEKPADGDAKTTEAK
ncbi:MAG: c-type cytochrome [Candidatus Sumerlaeaceae bacterium]